MKVDTACSTLLKTFHFLETQSTFCLYLQIAWNFLITFRNSTQSFNTIILTPLHLNLEVTALAQIAIICYYILFTNFFIWYETETYIGDTLWWIRLINGYINLVLWLFLNCILAFKLHSNLLPNLLRPKFNFIACVEADISI